MTPVSVTGTQRKTAANERARDPRGTFADLLDAPIYSTSAAREAAREHGLGVIETLVEREIAAGHATYSPSAGAGIVSGDGWLAIIRLVRGWRPGSHREVVVVEDCLSLDRYRTVG